MTHGEYGLVSPGSESTSCPEGFNCLMPHFNKESLMCCLNKPLGKKAVGIDVDLSNFFGTINHEKLVKLLRMKIKDERFIRYIVRMLKFRVMVNLRKTDKGSPQDRLSALYLRIFLHIMQLMYGLKRL